MCSQHCSTEHSNFVFSFFLKGKIQNSLLWSYMIVPVLPSDFNYCTFFIFYSSHTDSLDFLWTFSLNIFTSGTLYILFFLFPSTMPAFFSCTVCFLSAYSSVTSLSLRDSIFDYITYSWQSCPPHIILPSLHCFIHNSYYHLTCWYTIHFVLFVYLCVRMQAPWGLIFLSVLSRVEKVSALLLVSIDTNRY